MKKQLLVMGTMTSFVLAGCTTMEETAEPTEQAPAATTTTAELRGPSGEMMGTATASQSGDSIRVRIEAMNVPAGSHGAHVHMTGQCTAPGFESAGGHWNPTNANHGKDNPAGMHKGDMPNILIGTNGSGTLEYTIDNARISGGSGAMLDNDGAAIVIHAGPDDYRTDPSGNSGARIACGVFG